MEIVMTKLPNGVLAPASEEAIEKMQKLKVGAGVRVTVAQIRNYKFHKKYFALVKYAFDMWTDVIGPVEYQGQQVQPNMDRFRKDLTILSGHYERVFNWNGDMRLEPKSISFANMSEEEFEQLYSATINVILTKILASMRLDEQSLRNYIDNLMAFD